MQILLDVNDVYTEVDVSDKTALRIIKDVCRARPPGYQFSKAFKKKKWDGYVSVMEGKKFPTGLLRTVSNALREHKYTVKYKSLPQFAKTSVRVDILPGIELRDYQIEACEKLLYAGRGIAKMATNSGKTEVFAALLKHYNLQTLVIQSEVTLGYQTQERLQKYLPDEHIGFVGDGKRDFSNITVCLIKTLHNVSEEYKDFLKSNKIIILDECHHGSSDTYIKTLYNIPGWHRFGFSGTPLVRQQLLDLRLISMTGEVLVDIPNSYLIEQGYSAKPTIHMHVVESTDDSLWGVQYAIAYSEAIVKCEQRNNKVADLANESEGIILIFVSRIEHGKELQRLIDGSVFVSGQDSSDYRNQVLQDMRDRNGKVFIATNIFDEGIDVPGIDVLIYAVGGKSQRQLLQRIGRGLRKESKTLTVHDFIDDTNKYLLKHSGQRIETYEQEGFDLVLDEATTIVPLPKRTQETAK